MCNPLFWIRNVIRIIRIVAYLSIPISFPETECSGLVAQHYCILYHYITFITFHKHNIMCTSCSTILEISKLMHIKLKIYSKKELIVFLTKLPAWNFLFKIFNSDVTNCLIFKPHLGKIQLIIGNIRTKLNTK